MSERDSQQLAIEQRPADWVFINAVMDRQDAGLDLSESDSSFVRHIASRIDAIHSGGTIIPGTDEWIPGAVNYYIKTESENDTAINTSTPVDSRSARRVLNYDAAMKKREAEEVQADSNSQTDDNGATEAAPIKDVPNEPSNKQKKDKPTGDYSNLGTYDADFARTSGEVDADGKPVIGGFKGGHTYKLDENGKAKVIARDKYGEESDDQVDTGSATDPETEPDYDFESTLNDFLENTDSDGRDLAIERLAKLREWGLEGEINSIAMSDEDAMEFLLNEWGWETMEHVARTRGLLSEPVSTAQVTAPTPIEVTPTPGITLEDRIKSIELAKDLSDALDIARDEYVRLSAMRRGKEYGGKSDLDHAEQIYNIARDTAGAAVAEQLRSAGVSKDLLELFGNIGAYNELSKLTYLIKDAQLSAAEGKKLSGFYDWWARQDTGGTGRLDSFKQTVRPKNWGKTGSKGLAMGAITFIPSVGLGVVGAAVLGPALGILAGVGISRGIGKGLVGARINKRAGVKAAIEAQADEQIRVGSQNINWALGNISSDVVTRAVRAETNKSVRANRVRLVSAVALGAVAGSAGAVLGNFISGRAPNTLTDKPAFSTERRLEFPGGRPDVVEVQSAQAPVTAEVVGSNKVGAVNISKISAPPVVLPIEASVPSLPAGYDLGAMPSTNAIDFFHSPNPNALIQQTLDEYNLRTGHTFEWRQDGMFWEGGRVINPAELADYNRIMAELAEQSLQVAA